MILRALKIFRDVAVLGSFTRAAERNFVTQSAVSQQIRSLERTWGCTLFLRKKRTITVTEAGCLALGHVNAILDRYDLIRGELQAVSGRVAGPLRVGAIYSIGLYVLQPQVANFLKRYPDVDLQMEYLAAAQVVNRVKDGSLDLGLISYPRPRPGLTVIPFAKDRLVVIVKPGHRLAGRSELEATDLAGEPFIAIRRGLPTRGAIDQIFAQRNVRVRILHEFDNIDTVKRAVEVGDGISLVPSETVDDECRRGRLIRIVFENGRHLRPLGIICRRPPLAAPAEAFVRMLVPDALTGMKP